MIACSQPDITQPIAERLAGYLDCQSQSIAQTGFANLSGGWLGPALLGGCLTIYIALIGYRLLLGSPFGPREAVLAAIRAGVVIAIATSWPAYEAAIYRVAIEGPAEVAAELLPGGLAGASLSEAARRLDEDYKQLQINAEPEGGAPGAAEPATIGPPALAQTGSAQTSQTAAAAPNASSGVASDRGGLVLVMVTVGSLGALRLAGGLLLGLGPLFIVLGLFDQTLGLLEGWGRALFGVFVGTAGSLVVTSLQLDFIEAQIAQAVPPQPGALGEVDLMVIGLLFAAAMVFVLVLAVVVGLSFRIAPFLARRVTVESASVGVRRAALAPAFADAPMFEEAQRAQGIADAVRRLGRRETAMASSGSAAFGTDAGAVAGVQLFTARLSTAAATAPNSADAGALSYRRPPTRPQTPSAESRNRQP